MSRFSPGVKLSNSASTSAISSWFGNQFIDLPESFDSIISYTNGAGGASNITFSNIPQTYSSLQLRCVAKSTRSDIVISYNPMLTQFNDDTSLNYSYHRMRSDGASNYSEGGTSYNYLEFGVLVGSTASEANYYSPSVINILDYSSSNKYKSFQALAVNETATSYPTVVTTTGAWLSNAPITKITIRFDGYAQNLAQYSTFALYGIK